MMPITPELLDELLKDYKSPDDMFGNDGLLQQLTKAVVERALQGEMTHHLGYEKHSAAGQNSGNSRNGKSKKTIKGKRGQIEIDVPRDRESSFEPQLIKRGQTRFDGFDDKIISMYSRGMTCREIKAHLQEIYGVEVSPDLISTVTDSVIDEVRSWQSRPLDALYPILYLDALQVKVKDQGRVSNKAIYLAIGVNLSGIKEVLGMWASENEGAKFWLSIITELKNRGVKDIFIACVDGLKGFPEALETIYPKTQVQLCLVHLMRFSLAYVSFKERKAVAADLKVIYRAATAEEAEQHLAAFAEKWDTRYPSISKSWQANWARDIPMFGFPEDIRRAVYTTNAIESLNMSLRKVIKTRASFPNDEAAFKLLYLALRNIAKKWTMPIPHWSQAMQAFALIFEGRVPTLDGTSFTQFI
ncbi:MAG: IS256 family transposase [Acidobacteria bacterium]|jgi:putative transposase|nr:IS256 family transposase [Acidobacteriota bacterium]